MVPAVAQIAGDVQGSKVRAQPGLRESVCHQAWLPLLPPVWFREAPRLEECGRAVHYRRSCDTET